MPITSFDYDIRQTIPQLSLVLRLSTCQYQYRESKTASIAQDIALLAQEIERGERIVESLKQSRLNALLHMKMGEALLAPIAKLPRELLEEIFQHYCRDEYEELPLIGEHPADKLSSVCTLWRDIAQSSPMLWSYVHLPGFSLLGSATSANNPDDHTLPAYAATAKETLARCLALSKDASLHIIFSCNMRSDLKGINVDLLHQMLVHSRRWSSADITLDSLDAVSRAFSRVLSESSPFPCLQQLHLQIGDLYAPHNEFQMSRLSSLPSLRQFSVTCYDISQHSSPSCKSLIGSGITSLDVFDEIHDNDLIFLNQFDRLRHLYLPNYQGARLGSALCEAAVHSSSIRHLVLRAKIHLHTTVTLTLFSQLCLPNLHSLEISQFGLSPDGV
ncbi:hypothetical protein D9758_012846 [Tetrapyrgos nigripes]|uniref:F-box domain-containing protein n=1 Tax=Tetrapyrgos nigripes TaxID=182062 RepID=A0A8H5CAG8_9AGAR|nr:hypothetical protein D9758_012846 [Tetrapyrgos nigripes]